MAGLLAGLLFNDFNKLLLLLLISNRKIEHSTNFLFHHILQML